MSTITTHSKADQLILTWIDGDFSQKNIERIARYMSRTLRIGGLKACREMITSAMEVN